MSVNYIVEKRYLHSGKPAWHDPTISAGDLQQALRENAQAWEATDHFRQLQSQISSLTILPDITKVTAFALGSLTDGDGLGSRSVFQHNFLLALCEMLSRPGKELECCSQDPLYTAIDKEALEGYGIPVLDSPRGFLEVDSYSVVLSIAPCAPIKQIITDLARPAVIIWFPRPTSTLWCVFPVLRICCSYINEA